MTAPMNDQLALGEGRKRKSLAFKIMDADEGLVEAVFSTFNVIDHDGDVTLPGAFEDGAAVGISAYGHNSWMGGLPVGRGVIRVEKKRAVLEGQFFLSTETGRETFETIKQMGELQEWSYGYDVLDTGDVEDLPEPLRHAYRVLAKLHVHEVSPVLVGAGVDTETLSVKGKRAIPSHSTDVVDEAWDKGANVRRISNDAGKATLRRMYAWVDPDGDSDVKSSYKFPHHIVSAEGKVGAANVRACIAGIAVLNGARGGANIPDDDRQGVWKHLARHIRAADMEPAELSELEAIEKEASAALRELARFERTRARLLFR